MLVVVLALNEENKFFAAARDRVGFVQRLFLFLKLGIFIMILGSSFLISSSEYWAMFR